MSTIADKIKEFKQAKSREDKIKALEGVDLESVNQLIQQERAEEDVEFYRFFTKLQDENLLQIRAYCLLESEISKEKVRKFLDFVEKPTSLNKQELVVNDIIMKKLAKGKINSTTNDVKDAVIEFITEMKDSAFSTYQNIYKKNESSSTDTRSVRFKFPEFLDVCPTCIKFVCSKYQDDNQTTQNYKNSIRVYSINGNKKESEFKNTKVIYKKPGLFLINIEDCDEFSNSFELKFDNCKITDLDVDGRVSIRKCDPKID